jgi:hypothetical protein
MVLSEQAHPSVRVIVRACRCVQKTFARKREREREREKKRKREREREREREEREREKGDMEDLQYSHVQVEAIEKPV